MLLDVCRPVRRHGMCLSAIQSDRTAGRTPATRRRLAEKEDYESRLNQEETERLAGAERVRSARVARSTDRPAASHHTAR